MKQNKKYSAIIVAIIVLIFNLAIPSIAYTDISTNGIDFTNQPLTMAEYSSSSKPFYFCSSSWGAYQRFYYYFTSESDYYACFVKNQNGNYNYLVLSTSSGSGRYQFDSNSGSFTTIAHTGTDLYYTYPNSKNYVFESSWLQYSLIPSFNSESDAIAAVTDWIENPPVTLANPHPFNYSIPAGYALAVDITDLSPTGKITTVTNRAFASPHISNQTIAYVDTIPSNGTAPLGNGISWNGIGNKDLFGRYKSWLHNLIPQPNKSYLVVYNPVHIDNYVDTEHEDYNSAINITLTEARGGRLIALNTELTSSGQVGTVSSDNGGDISYDDDTNTWNTLNQNGTPYNPSPYGDYLPNTQNSVHDWLENISNQISGFFTGAIGAITNLVSAGSAFFQTLIGLYGWLPISVMSVLSSALIIVITIGVIKVFL